MRILNISGYKFITLYNIYTLKAWLTPLCIRLKIKGTVTLSLEGINVGVAGPEKGIREFIKVLHTDKRFEDIKFKESWSEEIPFRRFVVKCKHRIVPAEIPVDARESYHNLISPAELKNWLDNQEDLILIDTRNDYEIEYGTFTKAKEHDLKLKTFQEIHQKFKAIAEDPELNKKKVVMFCTGGIRCEKGIPLAKAAGLDNVYHLKGGILKYFEECGGDHYEGGCYVFDRRLALNPDLQPVEK